MPRSPRIKAPNSKIIPYKKIKIPSIQPACPGKEIIEREDSRIGVNESAKE